MAKGKVRVKVVWYELSEIAYGGVSLEVLRPVKEYVTEEAGDPVDLILRVSEESSKASLGDYFEVIVEDREMRRIMGEAPRRGYKQKKGVERIFPRPSRLLRVGILKGKSRVEGAMELGIEDAEWHSPRANLYIYEGKVKLGDDVVALIIDTENGRSIITRSRSRKKRSSQAQNGS